MPSIEQQAKQSKLEKIIYLFISASPGGFKIYVLLFIGFLSSKVQGDLANDLSIVGFLTMITAIGAGTQLLHLIPKKIDTSESDAKKVLKSALNKLLPYIFSICLFFYLIDHLILKSLSSDIQTASLLFVSSLYWIFRHYFLARETPMKLLEMEVLVWTTTTIGFIALYAADHLTTDNALITISASYFISYAAPLFTTMRTKQTQKIFIIQDSASIGLSNLISGGVINLAPSICYNLGNPALAGTMGLMVNISSITLTLIRSQLYKKSPEISLSIAKKSPDTISLCKNTQTSINKTIFISALVLQPVNIIASHYSQDSSNLYSTLGYSLLVTALICTPQLSAINSTVANFIGKSSAMLLANCTHAALVIATTSFFYIIFNEPSITFISFLASSSILFLGRNKVINLVTSKELHRITNSKSDHN